MNPTQLSILSVDRRKVLLSAGSLAAASALLAAPAQSAQLVVVDERPLAEA
jgi:hypothetical protein